MASAFWNSPFMVAVVTGLTTAVIAFARTLQRILTRLDVMDSRITDVQTDVRQIKDDDNIVRWSHIGPYTKWSRRRRG